LCQHLEALQVILNILTANSCKCGVSAPQDFSTTQLPLPENNILVSAKTHSNRAKTNAKTDLASELGQAKQVEAIG